MRWLLALMLMSVLLGGCEKDTDQSPVSPLPGALKELTPPPPPVPPPAPRPLPLAPTVDAPPDPQAGIRLAQEMFDKAEAARAKDPGGAMALYSEVVDTTPAKNELHLKAEKRIEEIKAAKKPAKAGADKPAAGTKKVTKAAPKSGKHK